MQTATEQPKRRGRPPKVALPEAPPVKLVKPSAPVLAKEIVDFVLARYDWNPGDWRLVLTSMAYVQRLGRYWASQTKKP